MSCRVQVRAAAARAAASWAGSTGPGGAVGSDGLDKLCEPGYAGLYQVAAGAGAGTLAGRAGY